MIEIKSLLDQLQFFPDKPAVLKVMDTPVVRQLLIGLSQEQVLKEHLTSIPTKLIVLQGSIGFQIGGQEHRCEAMDSFDIPVNVLHAVRGLSDKNIFLLTQEK